MRPRPRSGGEGLQGPLPRAARRDQEEHGAITRCHGGGGLGWQRRRRARQHSRARRAARAARTAAATASSGSGASRRGAPPRAHGRDADGGEPARSAARGDAQRRLLAQPSPRASAATARRRRRRSRRRRSPSPPRSPPPATRHGTSAALVALDLGLSRAAFAVFDGDGSLRACDDVDASPPSDARAPSAAPPDADSVARVARAVPARAAHVTVVVKLGKSDAGIRRREGGRSGTRCAKDATTTTGRRRSSSPSTRSRGGARCYCLASARASRQRKAPRATSRGNCSAIDPPSVVVSSRPCASATGR